MEEQFPTLLTLEVLASKGIKIARLAGNRDLKEKSIKAKKKSLKKCGMLIPAIIVSAKDALGAGLDVVDFETEKAVSYDNANQYVVLVDGSHRCAAHIELIKENGSLKSEEPYTGEFYMMYPLNQMGIAAMLTEINTATDPWKGGDYGKGASMLNARKELPLLDFVNDLTSKGYSLEAASKWATLAGKVNRAMLAKAMNGEIADILTKNNGLDRGRRLLDAAKEGFGEDFLKTRTLPDWVISKYEDADDAVKVDVISNIESFFKGMVRKDADAIEQAKGKRGGDTREAIINRELSRLFDAKYKA